MAEEETCEHDAEILAHLISVMSALLHMAKRVNNVHAFKRYVENANRTHGSVLLPMDRCKTSFYNRKRKLNRVAKMVYWASSIAKRRNHVKKDHLVLSALYIALDSVILQPGVSEKPDETGLYLNLLEYAHAVDLECERHLGSAVMWDETRAKHAQVTDVVMHTIERLKRHQSQPT